MMSNDEKIIKYLNDELTLEDKISFEAELRRSNQLKTEYEQYEKIAHQIRTSKSARLSKNYLNTILYEFHTKNKTKASKSPFYKAKFGYAFAILLAFLVSVVIFNNIFWQNSEKVSLQEFTESLSEDQKVELLENINGDIEDYISLAGNNGEIELTDMIQSDLSINNDIADVYDINYTELVGELSQVEAEKIYNEILNKNFSKEVN